MRPGRVDLGPATQPARKPTGTAGAVKFRDLFLAEQEKTLNKEGLRVSAHATTRLKAAGQTLSADQMAQVSAAIDRVAKKGSRESLVMLKDLALVVSVPNRTVITVVSGSRRKDNIFTNIDSAVILDGPDLDEEARGQALYQGSPAAREGGQVI
jgi:flagellar operon protein